MAFFLYGMKVMSDALMAVAGSKMRDILARMTSNRLFAVFTGFLITAVIQSSSATTLMVVSFVNASLLTLSEAIGVILGAHIGTTVTAWLITILGFKVSMSALALPLVGLGFVLTFSKGKKIQKWGHFTIGFAILFIGLQFLKESVPDVKSNPEILTFLSGYTEMGFASLLLFLGIGTILTLIIQSSSATMALTLVMCNEGWLPFDMAAAMVLGENIGTTITANLGAVVANYQAKRAARAHFISNTLGVIWMMLLLIPFLNLIDWLVTRNGGLSPFLYGEAIPVALSLFHTGFNVVNTLVLVGLIPIIVRIVEKIVSPTAEKELEIDMPKFLNKNALQYPQTAMSALFNESRRLFEGATYKIVAHGLNLHRKDIKSDEKLKRVVRNSNKRIEVDIDDMYYNKVKNIYSKIIKYATLTQSNFSLPDPQIKTLTEVKLANRYMVEAIKSTRQLQDNMAKYMISENVHIRNQYNRMRKKISRVLRGIHLVSIAPNHERHLKKLIGLKKKTNSDDVFSDGTLDQLIRDHLISSQMATSLANDSQLVSNISRKLVDAAELLYTHHDTLIEDM